MSRLHTRLLPLAAAAALCSTSAFALEFHGYLRSGSGVTGGGGDQTCFQLPGAYTKYRLGNECETYGEAQLDQNLYDGKDGVKFDYHLMFGYSKGYGTQQDYESLSNDGDWALRQNWIGVKGLPILNGASVWAGKRYYKREDVHMTDFYYHDTSGYGAGIEDIQAGPGKFSYALLRNTDNDRGITRHDFRYEGVSLGAAGSLDFSFELNRADSTNGADAENGSFVQVQHMIPMFGGFNKLAVQYGRGSANNLVLGYPVYDADSDDRTWRILDWGVVEFAPSFSGMYILSHQDTKDNYSWTTVGIRPVWHITDYFKLQAELGHDRVKPDGLDTMKLTKFTIAPTLVAGRGFWARPELRLFVTHAKWNDAARDQWGGVAGGSTGRFGSDTNGTTYGFQVEAWW